MFRPVCGKNQQYVLKGGGEYKFPQYPMNR